MTEQTPNDQFHASSFMQGHNAEYLEQLYAQYANDQNAVDEAWGAFFRGLGDAELDIKKAMKIGIKSIVKLGKKSGIKCISAGNYGGKLGPYLFYLRSVIK